jgi:hypothetical protein
MKRIERVIVDECIGQTSALPGQLRSRLGEQPIKFVFLATEHPGIPDIEILDKLLDAGTALLTQDRVLHNLAICPNIETVPYQATANPRPFRHPGQYCGRRVA